MALVDWSDPAAEQVLRLVCGLPPDMMASRQIMVLQAFFDDSTQAGKVTVLAGYMAEAQDWVQFSREWRELLSIREPWPRFKMSEIMRDGGDISHERAEWHYRAIEKYAKVGICVAIPHEPFFRLMREFSCPQEWNNPYYMAHTLLLSVLQHVIRPYLPDKTVDLVFDYQSESRKALDAWDALTQGGTINVEFVKNPPIYRSDDQFLPLQAADLFALHLRKRFVDSGTIESTENPFPWPLKSLAPDYIYSEATETVMRRHILRSLGLEFAAPLVVPGRGYLWDSLHE